MQPAGCAQPAGLCPSFPLSITFSENPTGPQLSSHSHLVSLWPPQQPGVAGGSVLERKAWLATIPTATWELRVSQAHPTFPIQNSMKREQRAEPQQSFRLGANRAHLIFGYIN
jgi:hypothetical protein